MKQKQNNFDEWFPPGRRRYSYAWRVWIETADSVFAPLTLALLRPLRDRAPIEDAPASGSEVFGSTAGGTFATLVVTHFILVEISRTC